MSPWFISKAWYANVFAAIWCALVAVFVVSRGEYSLASICAALAALNIVWAMFARRALQGSAKP